jgi:hypothetical protein
MIQVKAVRLKRTKGIFLATVVSLQQPITFFPIWAMDQRVELTVVFPSIPSTFDDIW